MADPKQAAQTANPAESADALKAEVERLKAEAHAAKEEAEAARTLARAAREEKEAAEAKLKEQSDALDAEVSRQEEAIQRQLRSQRKVRIIIASGKDPQDCCPVPVAVNGREYLIVRDKEVDVPQGVLDVLDLAVEQVAEAVDEAGQNRTVFRPAQRFSYRVLGHIDPATGELARM
ncbi:MULTISPECIES: hypothetical protein [unclassified Desulfovibrio]|uniref:hypothetical protein n=1 Tax=unclassified Desulfovibrio TaxID=2593640 RepID=UPI0013ED1E9E|nr:MULTISPECIES: hypothetical protein [unclassified Desulfovibrio]